MKETIHLFYTNDLHSYFDNWSQVATFIKSGRMDAAEKGETAWTLDIGDHMDRVHPLTEATLGGANVALLNDLQYDLATLGNNEGITLSHEHLYNLYDEADFHVVCSNLECVRDKDPAWLQMSQVLESKHGVKLGFIGLTARFNPYYHLLGWNVKDIYDTVAEQVELLREQVDVIVLLSHVGIHFDQQIAERFPDVDVIIGSHTHHLLRKEEVVNESILTAGGKLCDYAGHVTLVWDHEVGKLVEKTAQTCDVTNLAKDLATEQKIADLQVEAKTILDEVIAQTDEAIESNWFKETPMMKKFTKKLREWTGADIGMLNAGLIVEDFPAGNITYGDIHRICPHPINPVVVELTGADLMSVVEQAFSPDLTGLKLRGFGFRGKVVGRMVFDNLEVTTTHDYEGLEVVEEILYEGAPLDEAAVYRVATGDMFTFGRLLPEVAQAESKKIFLPEFIRKMLVHALIEYDHES